MSPQVISVKDFVDILNETLGFAYPQVTIEGEVSSFKVNQGKWVFFDLKDQEATLGCFMPVYQLKVPLEDGMKVRVTGTPRLTKWGKFSFTVKLVELAGEGELRRAFELLKQRLGDEGLFDPERKRPLPEFPQTIGLIASRQSAAYADFMKILNGRWSGVRVVLADVQVQGAPAPDQIVAALDYFNQIASPPDILVLVRGGGSLEDLQAFNTEAVARAVASSRTPIIVGVGHEVDESLADFAADRRAATPTDAARIVVPDRDEVAQRVTHATRMIEQAISRELGDADRRLQRFLSITERFLALPAERLNRLEAQVRRDMQLLSERTELRVGNLQRVLASFDPAANLRRGYAIVTNAGKVLKTVQGTKSGDTLVIQLADGKLSSRVNDG
ncbi:MAG TPA: exodeoxyribonuclease VII large subunit [Candidatus Nanoarchaeia archaeon]|nr:exodeoxyribonuclease VII large subunit [Candidatus Nanoarchaeia archaeon]